MALLMNAGVWREGAVAETPGAPTRAGGQRLAEGRAPRPSPDPPIAGTITKTYCSERSDGARGGQAGTAGSKNEGRSAARRIAIDVLPEDPENVVDAPAMLRIPVAILGASDFDPRTVDPVSVTLGGAAVVKSKDGSIALQEDVDGDGVRDLVVRVSALDLKLADPETELTLHASTFTGEPLEGTAVVRSLAHLLRARREARVPLPTATAQEKRASIEARIVVVPAEAAILHTSPAAISHAIDGDAELVDVLTVAVLGGEALDVRDVELATVDLDGSPITRGPRGGLRSFVDVNGDGVLDLLLSFSTRRPPAAWAAGHVTLSALTQDGRTVVGHADLDAAASSAFAVSTASGPPTPGEPDVAEYTNSGTITINDNTAASPYPATIGVSGLTGVVAKVRVTLHGVFHSCLQDLDVMLVGPTGQSAILMSDVGGCPQSPGVVPSLHFDDNAAGPIPVSSTPQTGTYQPTNFVLTGDPFPGPAPGGIAPAVLGAFAGTNPNGTWQLFVVDDAAGDTGAITGGWTLDLVMATQACNPAPATIPANAPGATMGPASLYPSTITVSGVNPQVVSSVSVTLAGLSHTFPDDLDILMTSPHNRAAVLMSDAGGANPISDLSLTFERDAATRLPDSGGIFSAPRTYQPTDFEAGDVFPAPAPAGPYTSDLATFYAIEADGAWSLYITDDAALDVGSLSGGWCLTLTTVAPQPNCNGGPVAIPEPPASSGTATPYPSRLSVLGTSGIIVGATATLSGLTHTYPADLDVLLESPGGQSAILMSDAGGSSPVSNLTLTFDDLAPIIPMSGPLVSGSYRPFDYDPADTWPLPAQPAPNLAELMDNFRGYPANGNWDLFIVDDSGGDVGSLSNGWCLNLTTMIAERQICNDDAPIAIPAGPPGTTMGPAGPYPSIIHVESFPTPMRRAFVTLWGLTHTFPDDLDIMLLTPTGKRIMLMSDAGGGTDVSNLNLGFIDGGPLQSDNGPLVASMYRPFDFEPGDSLPAPAPGAPYTASLGDLYGDDPNGDWKLYIADDALGDSGTLASGWCLQILPHYPIEEAKNLRWRPGTKDQLQWDNAPNSDFYRVYRGNAADLPRLLTGESNACLDEVSSEQRSVNQLFIPHAGALFWYLVVGANDGEEGPSGLARIGTEQRARVISSIGPCASP